jgi:hypothetical protein
MMQWKQCHILYIKIDYKHNMMRRKSILEGGMAGVIIKEKSTKAVEKCKEL